MFDLFSCNYNKTTNNNNNAQETYNLAVDGEKQAMVLRTSNKKYFKVFQVPALVRAGVPLQRSSARMSHNGQSTLVIAYDKPESIVDRDREDRASAVRDSNGGGGGGSLLMAKTGGNGDTRGAKVAPAIASVGGGDGEISPGCSQS